MRKTSLHCAVERGRERERGERERGEREGNETRMEGGKERRRRGRREER